MPSPNEELQEIEDEYFRERFDAKLRQLFSARTLKIALVCLLFFLIYTRSLSNNVFHYLPSRLGTVVGFGISAFLALGFMILGVLRVPRAAFTTERTKQPNPFAVCVVSVIVAAFFAPVTFNFCLGLATELSGAPGQQRATETRWRYHYRRWSDCAGPEIRDVWYDRNIVCVDRHRENEFPTGSHLTLRGKVSPLGMNVEDAVAHW